ncbi:MAG: transposase [Methanobrevibacter sp.]|nr:transposase [Methanobrevibacter sp.]
MKTYILSYFQQSPIDKIADKKVLKVEKVKNERTQGETQLARKLANTLEEDLWKEKFKKEKKIVLILDNAPIHIAALTKRIAPHLNMELIYLPKYASDLNPIERLWYAIKRELSTEFIEDVNYLKENFELYFEKFTQTDSLAKIFLQKFII